MSNLYFTNGRVYLDGAFAEASVTVREGRVAALGGGNDAGLPECDLRGRMLVPGFIDVHTHGGDGVDVNAADAAALRKLARFFASQGTTSFLASVLTDTQEQTVWCIGQIRQAIREASARPDGAEILGIHLEGPFLAPEYKGAMPEHLLRTASRALFDTYQDAAGGLVRYITMSPEVEGVPELVGHARESGAAVAIGHSGADYDTAMACINNGAVAATHTFNVMKLMHQHFPAISGAVLESDVYCEAICDGRHLHPAIVRLLLKVKGWDRVVAVTDSIMAAGLPDGSYKLGVNDVTVTDGDALLTDGGARAGSTLTTGAALRNLVAFTARPVEQALPLLTSNPARLLGMDGRKGSIAVGKDADFAVLDGGLRVVSTIVRGVVVYRAENNEEG